MDMIKQLEKIKEDINQAFKNLSPEKQKEVQSIVDEQLDGINENLNKLRCL